MGRKKHRASRRTLPPPARPAYGHLRREFLIALGVVFLVTLGKMALESTPDGEALQFLSYDRQQAHVEERRTEQPLFVAVADLTAVGLQPEVVEGRQELVTPRAPVLKLLRQLANRGALAVAVDVDFSPHDGVYLPEDPRFLHACSALKDDAGRPVPVFLGVRDRLSRPPEQWLGPGLEHLAANMLAPRADHRKMTACTRAERYAPLPSLSARLASVYPGARTPADEICPEAESDGKQATSGASPQVHPETSTAADTASRRATAGRRERLAEQFANRAAGPALSVREFLVDYSPLGRLLESRIAVEPDGSLPEHAGDGEIAGKLVLVGYATPDKTTDMVRVPGREDEVPGVFAHACAVHTLVERPFFELNDKVRLLLDLFLAAVLLAVVFGVRLWAEWRGWKGVNPHRLELVTILVLVVITWMAGSELPIKAGVVWTDYVLVVLALFAHPYAGTVWEWLVERIFRGKHAPEPGADAAEGGH